MFKFVSYLNLDFNCPLRNYSLCLDRCECSVHPYVSDQKDAFRESQWER